MLMLAVFVFSYAAVVTAVNLLTLQVFANICYAAVTLVTIMLQVLYKLLM